MGSSEGGGGARRWAAQREGGGARRWAAQREGGGARRWAAQREGLGDGQLRGGARSGAEGGAGVLVDVIRLIYR